MVDRPFRNRVRPDGALVADPARGTLTGNRGGRIHDAEGRIVRRWASRMWIACDLVWRDQRKTVMGPGYTNLFFLDEATALAAGHRPCYFCRRAEARAFAAAWAAAHGLAAPPRAPDLDRVLHAQRLGARPAVDPAAAPPGAILAAGQGFLLVHARGFLPWRPAGYGAPVAPPAAATLVTPAGVAAALAAGYAPRLHPSAAG
jgi:hypothetical protein